MSDPSARPERVTLSDEERDAIRARCEAATEGPWRQGVDEDGDPVVLDRSGDLEHTIDFRLTADGRLQGTADAEFIAHAREDVPALVAEVDRLAAREQALREEIARELKDAVTAHRGGPYFRGIREGLGLAARIARGETR